jgi:hypothetical protein
MGVAVPELPSGRESFSPDSSYLRQPLAGEPDAVHPGATHLGRRSPSENDYSVLAEAEQTTKRAGYFAAGTRIVWDAAPAAPGWRGLVDELCG